MWTLDGKCKGGKPKVTWLRTAEWTKTDQPLLEHNGNEGKSSNRVAGNVCLPYVTSGRRRLSMYCGPYLFKSIGNGKLEWMRMHTP